MARGNEIIVSANPRGIFDEGYVAAGETHYPGMIVEKDPTVALKGGRHTYKLATPGADGGIPKGSYWVVRADNMQGRTITTAYAAGERTFVYSPISGEELNLLLADVAGTGDLHTAGEVLILKNATGKLIATTGSPAVKCAKLLETIPAPTADTLAWCEWAGAY